MTLKECCGQAPRVAHAWRSGLCVISCAKCGAMANNNGYWLAAEDWNKMIDERKPGTITISWQGAYNRQLWRDLYSEMVHANARLTRDEFDKMMGIIDAAMEANRQGGILSEIEKNVDDKLKELWDWFQTLKIEPN